MKGNWGILGGAFDPIHRGHTNLADEIRVRKHLDGILLVPSLRPPHKTGSCAASFDHRVRMAELATRDNRALRVSRIEEEIDGPGYTLSLMRHIKAAYPDVQFSFIVGADIVHEFDSWNQPDKILQEMPVLVGTRKVDEESAGGTDLYDRFEVVETGMVNLSSSAIRAQIRSGISTDELAKLVGRPVADYIEREGLYQ